MPFVLTLLLCLVSLTAAAGTDAPATSPAPRLRGIVAKAAPSPAPRLRGIVAKFVQVRHLGELDMDVESRGKVACDFACDRLRWQVDHPVASVTLIDGEKLVHRDGETGNTAVLEVEKFPWLKLLREAMGDWLSGDRGRLAERFDVISAGKDALHLVPRDPALKKLCRSVDIAFAPKTGTVSSIRIAEDSGDTLTIRFYEVGVNPKWSPRTWRMP